MIAKDAELLGQIIGGFIVFFILVYVFMVAWGIVAVAVFGLPALTYWESFWTVVLISFFRHIVYKNK